MSNEAMHMRSTHYTVARKETLLGWKACQGFLRGSSLVRSHTIASISSSRRVLARTHEHISPYLRLTSFRPSLPRSAYLISGISVLYRGLMVTRERAHIGSGLLGCSVFFGLQVLSKFYSASLAPRVLQRLARFSQLAVGVVASPTAIWVPSVQFHFEDCIWHLRQLRLLRNRLFLVFVKFDRHASFIAPARVLLRRSRIHWRFSHTRRFRVHLQYCKCGPIAVRFRSSRRPETKFGKSTTGVLIHIVRSQSGKRQKLIKVT